MSAEMEKRTRSAEIVLRNEQLTGNEVGDDTPTGMLNNLQTSSCFDCGRSARLHQTRASHASVNGSYQWFVVNEERFWRKDREWRRRQKVSQDQGDFLGFEKRGLRGLSSSGKGDKGSG